MLELHDHVKAAYQYSRVTLFLIIHKLSLFMIADLQSKHTLKQHCYGCYMPFGLYMFQAEQLL